MKKKIFDKYAKAVAQQFHLSLEDLFVRTKKIENVEARQLLYYLCMERPIRIAYIQRFLNESGYSVAHSTIIHGYKKAKKLIDSDKDFKDVIEKINEDVH
tara:strand:- start:464 stop:763 length:300 start_codon:yes stop_codon:yes gene_type:complete